MLLSFNGKDAFNVIILLSQKDKQILFPFYHYGNSLRYWNLLLSVDRKQVYFTLLS